MKQMTNTYRNHFSRSYENRSNYALNTLNKVVSSLLINTIIVVYSEFCEIRTGLLFFRNTSGRLLLIGKKGTNNKHPEDNSTEDNTNIDDFSLDF